MNRQKSYRGFILDADNTLLDFNRAEREALGQALAANGYQRASLPEESFDTYHRINDHLWKHFEQGSISQDRLRVERFRLLFEALPSSDRQQLLPDPKKVGEDYISFLSEKGYLLPNALTVLQALSSTVPLALVSNGIASVQHERLARSSIDTYFKSIIISGDVGISKPDPEIFCLALQQLDLSAGAVLCVGDSPSSDIRGGQRAGLDTCLFAPFGFEYPQGWLQPTYTINDLRQLLCFLP